MTIQIDSREKQKAIAKILNHFNENEIKHYSSKLFVGDYMNLDNPRKIVDRKQNLTELCGNVCQQHVRFINEIERANEHDIKLVFLCEHSANIRNLEDVKTWLNPRIKNSPKAISGEKLYKILNTISERYSVDFEFCSKNKTGEKIIELLKN